MPCRHTAYTYVGGDVWIDRWCSTCGAARLRTETKWLLPEDVSNQPQINPEEQIARMVLVFKESQALALKAFGPLGNQDFENAKRAAYQIAISIAVQMLQFPVERE